MENKVPSHPTISRPVIEGICVLKTPSMSGKEFEYRPSPLTNIAELHKMDITDTEGKTPEVLIRNARVVFATAPVFPDIRQACVEAEKMKQSTEAVCKYGVFTFNINIPF